MRLLNSCVLHLTNRLVINIYLPIIIIVNTYEYENYEIYETMDIQQSFLSSLSLNLCQKSVSVFTDREAHIHTYKLKQKYIT